MSVTVQQFFTTEAMNAWIAAHPCIILEQIVMDKAPAPGGQDPAKPPRTTYLRVYQPHSAAVVHSTGVNKIGFDAKAQIGTAAAGGRWWVKGTDDDATFGGELPAENTLINDTFKGNGRRLYFGPNGGGGSAFMFSRAIIHVYGTVVAGQTESVAVYGLTPSGGKVLLGSGAIANTGGGEVSLNATTEDNVENFVGLEFETSDIQALTSLHCDIFLVAE